MGAKKDKGRGHDGGGSGGGGNSFVDHAMRKGSVRAMRVEGEIGLIGLELSDGTIGMLYSSATEEPFGRC